MHPSSSQNLKIIVLDTQTTKVLINAVYIFSVELVENLIRLVTQIFP